MSDNKFILQLKGTQTPKSVVEIKNDKLVTPFTGVPHSTDVVGSIIDDKDSSVVVAKGAQNWKLDGSSLVVASSLSGDGSDYTGEFNVSGNGLWINAVYSLPATIFSAGTKWALKLCGKNLLTTSGQTIGFTLIVKIGNTHITSKTFTVVEGANLFCRQLVIDFSESEQAIIKAQSGDILTVQLLCSDANASATIYNGMTVFTALQRRVDADVVASDEKTFDEVVQDIIEVGEEIDQISDSLLDHIADKNNPHNVTKAQVGLGNVDNTSDLNKPISTATQNALDDITDLIPAQATPQNQLGDKNFINSSIATNTANFIGTFNSVAELEAYSGTVTNNDYAFVIGTDTAGNTTYNRYKYNASTQQWIYEYTLNNSSFTAAQWATINSGATSSDVSLARSSLQPGDLPTVGNGTITITQGGTTKGTFTTNQDGNTTIDLEGTILDPHRVIEFQAPTAQNNYTWYRKHADGWVEQGGVVSNSSITTTWAVAVVFPVEMSNTNYSYQITPKLESFNTNGGAMGTIYQNTTTGFMIEVTSKYSNAGNTQQAAWCVEGMAA